MRLLTFAITYLRNIKSARFDKSVLIRIQILCVKFSLKFCVNNLVRDVTCRLGYFGSERYCEKNFLHQELNKFAVINEAQFALRHICFRMTHIGLHYRTSRYRPTIKCVEVLQQCDITKCFMRLFDQWRHYITCENNDY